MWKAYKNHVGQGGGRSCEVCKSVNDTSHLKRRDTDEMFNILNGPLDCNSNHVIQLFIGMQTMSISLFLRRQR